MNGAIITLLTDWSNNDHYFSALQGKLLSRLPEARIINLSNHIPVFGIVQASFVLRNSFFLFPQGTIHIVGVNSEASDVNPHVVVSHEGHLFIGADNGIFGLVFNDKPYKAIKLPLKFTTFPELDVFADAAIFLAGKGNMNSLGEPFDKLYLPVPLRATIDNSIINGSVIYIDSYNNAITNITKEVFERVGQGRRYEILVQSNYNKITKINTFYNETSNGELLALFNSLGLLEIAIYKGSAADLLNLGQNATVRIRFFNTPEREELKLE
jgi:S-adenosyl-L-methionine hydrolase (adenosine-forming)